MRITKGIWALGLMSAVSVIWLWSYGCDKRPTKPGPEPEPPKDYVVYTQDFLVDSVLYGYHVLSGQLDTIVIPGPSPRLYRFKVSADGLRFYLRYFNYVRVVSTYDFSTIIDLPFRSSWGISVSPDNRHIALHGGGFRILETQNYSVVFLDTVGASSGVFSANGQRYYGRALETDCPAVYRVDLENDFTVDTLCMPGDFGVGRVIPSVDEQYLYMFRSLGGCYAFLDVYDIVGDSLVFRDGVAPACGDMVMTPDDRSMFFTAPGDLHGWPPNVYTFARYDADTRTIDSLLYFSRCGSNDSTGVLADAIVITPDGRYVLTCGMWGSRILVYDVAMGDTVRVDCFEGMGLNKLTCQNGR